MAANGDNGTNNLSSRARAWFERLSRVKKVLATSAALVITIGGVASATTSVLDLGGRLGAGQPETPRIAPVKTFVQVNRSVREGVRVTEVIPGSAADRAGVEVQDVVTDIDGKAIEDVDDFENALKRARPGETMLVSLIRDSQGESQIETLPVKLERIEGTDLKAGVQVEDTVPQQTFISALDLPTPPSGATNPGQESTGAEPPTGSPEPNPSVNQYAP
jgi:hypothetical protein